MADRAFDFLTDIYGIPEERIQLIHHGIPDVPFVDPAFYKDQFDVEGKKVILTFGLLGPSKGLENMIEALPADYEETSRRGVHRLGRDPPRRARPLRRGVPPRPATPRQRARRRQAHQVVQQVRRAARVGRVPRRGRRVRHPLRERGADHLRHARLRAWAPARRPWPRPTGTPRRCSPMAGARSSPSRTPKRWPPPSTTCSRTRSTATRCGRRATNSPARCGGARWRPSTSTSSPGCRTSGGTTPSPSPVASTATRSPSCRRSSSTT